MFIGYNNLVLKVFQLPESHLKRTIKNLAKQLKVNRRFLTEHLGTLKKRGLIRSKRIGLIQNILLIKRGKMSHEISRFIRA